MVKNMILFLIKWCDEVDDEWVDECDQNDERWGEICEKCHNECEAEIWDESQIEKCQIEKWDEVDEEWNEILTFKKHK